MNRLPLRGGAEGSRTPVQTSIQTAFYILIGCSKSLTSYVRKACFGEPQSLVASTAAHCRDPVPLSDVRR